MTVSDQDTKVRISDLPLSGKFSLRCSLEDPPSLEQALGLSLPTKIGEMRGTGKRNALCLGPDEWLILCNAEERADLTKSSALLYDTTPHSLVDVSYRELAIEITGPGAETLLSTCCPRDLTRLAEGHGTRTVFDAAQVVIIRTGAETFHLFIWRTFYPHVRGLMSLAENEIALGL